VEKNKTFSIDDPVATLLEVATTLDTIVVEVSWDVNVFGKNSDVPLYFHLFYFWTLHPEIRRLT